MTTAHKAALRRFPDLDSCLFSWGSRPLWNKFPEDQILHNFAWREIYNPYEAEVCLFRVLSHIGNHQDAERWFSTQGFMTHVVPPGVPSQYNKIYHLQASWLISASGQRFYGESFLARIMPSVSYSMIVYTYWDPDRERLLGINIS